MASNAEPVTMHGALSENDKARVFLGTGLCFCGGFLGQKAKTEEGPVSSFLKHHITSLCLLRWSLSSPDPELGLKN